MKKILVYAIIVIPIILVWLHWGGIKNDIGTLTLMMAATFICTVATDKMEGSAEDDKNPE